VIIPAPYELLSSSSAARSPRLAYCWDCHPWLPIATRGLLRNSNSVVLNGKPLDRDINDALGQSVRLENNANCFAISEAADGAGAGCRVVFGAILGTGVGGGIVIEGRILTGLNRIGGEWGHNPLPWATEDERPGYRCYCGKFGCIETFLSGAGLAREYFSLSKNELTAEQIAAAEKTGEPYAVRSLATYQDRLARSLAALVNILGSELINSCALTIRH
jgi:fructokinase